MAFTIYIYRLGDSIEYEIKHKGRYGAKGEKRAPRQRPTPEQVKKQNQQNKATLVRRLIKLNFSPGDMWTTLKYPKGARPGLEQIQKDIRNFISRLRRAYTSMGEELRYIYRLEIGRRGGVHIHIIVNRSRGRPDTDKLIQEKWLAGRINCESLYERGGYQELAEYMVKQPDEEARGQLSFFPEEERKHFCTYSSSRNLLRPVPEKHIYSHRTLRRLIKDGPRPSEGYYIDKNSIICGVNPYTGMSYYRYTEVRIKENRRPAGKGGAYARSEHIHTVRDKQHPPG